MILLIFNFFKVEGEIILFFVTVVERMGKMGGGLLHFVTEFDRNV